MTEAEISPEQEPLHFDEFTVPTTEEWRQAAVQSLKGKPLEKLIAQTVEGIEIRPLLHQEDIAGVAHTAITPGQPPYVRGPRPKGYLDQPWLIAQALPYSSPQQFNEALRHDLERGQTAVFWAPEADYHADDVVTALNGVDLTQTLLLIPCHHGLSPLALLAAVRHSNLAYLRGGLLNDPLAWLAGEGSQPLAAMYNHAAALTRWAAEYAPRFTTLAVMPAIYHESGASAGQELAVMLATAVTHIRELQQRGLDIETIAPRLSVVMAIGGDFFMEIAKLRAARLLWTQMIAAFGGDETAQKLTLHAHTAERNKSRLDPHNNMLRVTTESFAGALAGVDSLQTAPFDAQIRPPDEFSRRLARNIQIILQEEVNLTQLIDPAGGAYVVEYLTDELARKSWALFQEIEAQGGMLAALQNGFVQQQVAETVNRRQERLATRRDVLVGVNMYANPAEEPLAPAPGTAVPLTYTEETDPTEALDALAAAPTTEVVDRAIEAAQAGATLAQISEALFGKAEMAAVESLRPFRAAAPFEALRQKAEQYVEKYGRPPQIFLANMGPLRRHKARADFARGFFEVGGFEVIYPDGFDSPETAAQAALEAKARAVVICADDDDYPKIAAPLVRTIQAKRPDTIVILAGYPKDQIEAHKTAGIDKFIYQGADCLALNQWLQEKLIER